MKRCTKVPYTKQEAKSQLYLRNRDRGTLGEGGIYRCRQHNAYHLSKSKYPIIHERVWDKIKSKRT